MKFIGYKCEFNGKFNEMHILINEKSNREIPGFYKISRDISRPKIEPGSRELNPSQYLSTQHTLHTINYCLFIIQKVNLSYWYVSFLVNTIKSSFRHTIFVMSDYEKSNNDR